MSQHVDTSETTLYVHDKTEVSLYLVSGLLHVFGDSLRTAGSKDDFVHVEHKHLVCAMMRVSLSCASMLAPPGACVCVVCVLCVCVRARACVRACACACLTLRLLSATVIRQNTLARPPGPK